MILMKIDGIDGTSDIKGHEKWIQCETLGWSIGRGIPTESGRTRDRTQDVVTASEIVITKRMDSSSSRLFEAAGGTEGKKVEIHFLAGAGKDAPTHAEWTLENTLISSYSVSGDTNDAMETLALNFVKIEVKSIVKEPGDTAGSPYPVVFDRSTGVLGG
ncbi:MAG: type VI secretion system tube protein Hcp [Pseudomonadota bacterium]|nr:type VI secretion system tube protein Hcp [Pseudomonadota bacterium]